MMVEATTSWPPTPDTPHQLTADIRHVLAPNASSWTYEGTNSYVISNGGHSLIIDPGIENQDHLDTLTRLAGEGGALVRGVLLTHDHPDHSDGARTLAGQLDVPLLAMSARFASEFLTPDQVLSIGQLQLNIVHTPGHSDDSVCLWLPEQRLMFTGDTLLGGHTAAVMGKLGELLDSLAALTQLVGQTPALTLPGHGPSFTTLSESADRITSVRRRRINEMRGYINSGDTTLDALIARLYPQHAGSRAMFAMQTIISTVEYLVDQSGDDGIANPDYRAGLIAEIADFRQELAAQARARTAQGTEAAR